MKAWINGALVDETDARVSIFDAGFQHGVGLFETMHARNGRVFRAKAHMDRLAASAAELRLTQRLQVEPLVEAVDLCLASNELDRARMRLTLTGGNLNLLRQSPEGSQVDPTIAIQCQEAMAWPAQMYEQGVAVTLASGRVNPYDPMCGHKTLNYWPRLLNLQVSAGSGGGEALWLTPSAHVAGGCVSNLFIVQDGSLHTPLARGEETAEDLPSATLPGVTRAAVIEVADAAGIGTRRATLSLDDLLAGDEAFLTNSSWGILPVVGVRAATSDGDEQEHIDRPVGGGVGEVTQSLRDAYEALVESETT